MNGKTDVFVRDMQAGTTVLVSVDSRGRPANRDSSGAGISADGRYITFVSRATNLVAGDTNGEQDVFLRDRTAGTTERVNVGAGGEQANGTNLGGFLSADGSVVAFASAATNLTAGTADGRRHVFVRDRRAGTTTLVSVGLGGAPANASSDVTALSPDGGFVAFQSAATDLVPGDTNRKLDVFVRDLRAGTTARASVARDGGQAYGRSGNGVISGGGREIAFTSDAGNLVPGGTDRFGDVFVRRR